MDTDPEKKLLRKLFVGNMNYNTTEQELKDYFERLVMSLLNMFPYIPECSISVFYSIRQHKIEAKV